jgi:Tat protein secretion system quality control protein TatD with DNase activity
LLGSGIYQNSALLFLGSINGKERESRKRNFDKIKEEKRKSRNAEPVSSHARKAKTEFFHFWSKYKKIPAELLTLSPSQHNGRSVSRDYFHISVTKCAVFSQKTQLQSVCASKKVSRILTYSFTEESTVTFADSGFFSS